MKARTSMTIVLDPVLRFRVIEAQDGYVTLEIYPIVAGDGDLPKRLVIEEGAIWSYTLTLNSQGWHQENDVQPDPLAARELPAARQRRIGWRR